MIEADQPTRLGEGVIAGVSSRNDGTMLDRTLDDRHAPHAVDNRRTFCKKIGINYDHCVYQIITYGPDVTYDMIQRVDVPDTKGVHADVLYTEMPGVGLFLPVADCVGTILYDPTCRALALAHIGRHASLANTLSKTIAYFLRHGSNANDIHIWMAPSVKKGSYRMEYFDAADTPEWRSYCEKKPDGYYLDLLGYNTHLAVLSGIPRDQIVCSDIDTATNPQYYSHSQGDAAGRFAVVAMLR